MRYFVSTGEASGELSGVLLAEAIRSIDPRAQFEGIGHQRMRDAGFTVWRDHHGWASMGPLAAIPRIPGLLATMWQTARHIARTKPDLVILVDFGAFNVRLAKTLRVRLRYDGPILDMFPPATWLDNEKRAREISSYAVPLTAFEHQYDFYKRLQLPIVYFGHPLAAQYTARAPLPAPASNGGCIALLPGSRAGELRYHVPALVQAYRLLKSRRPQLRGVFGAADARGEATLRATIAREGLIDVTVERGVQAAIANIDAAWVASGTAVLETTLSGVPAVALYVIAPILVKHARRVYSGRYITLPNLIVNDEIVPELLQGHATPSHLADAMDRLLNDPSRQVNRFAELRAALGPPDALERCAKFAVALARTGGM
ncbi:MAG: lipid-A-disaccharide synthase [Vulcanimicrobiaceae bacterium]